MPNEVKKMREREKEFTLVEIVFAIFVGLLLMSAAYVAMTAGQQTSAGVERKVAAQQDVRAAMQIMGLELSMASYNPFYMPNLWHDLPAVGAMVDCTPKASDKQELKGIREATPTAITVEMDIGENGQAGDDQGEIVRYEYVPGADKQYITRETANCGKNRDSGAAQPFLGADPSKGKPRTVRVINDLRGIPVFQYFDSVGAGASLNPGANSNDIPRIRRIDITLAVETDEVDPSTRGRKQMIYSTSVLVRNHVF